MLTARRVRLRFSVGLGVVTLFAVVACAAPGGAASSDARARDAAVALAALRPYADAVGAAEAVLVSRCVRDRGSPVPGDPPAEPDAESLALLPPPTPQSAGDVGYGIAVRLLNAQTPEARLAWQGTDEAAKAAATQVLFGDPGQVVSVTFDDGYTADVGADGCFADVRRTLYGDLTEYTRRTWVTSQAAGRVPAALAASTRWADATAAWAACTAATGSPYSSAGEMRADLYRARSATVVASAVDRADKFAALRDRERDLARQDARCAQDAGLGDVWTEAVAAGDADYLSRHRDEIVAWSTFLAERADAAVAEAQSAAAA